MPDLLSIFSLGWFTGEGRFEWHIDGYVVEADVEKYSQQPVAARSRIPSLLGAHAHRIFNGNGAVFQNQVGDLVTGIFRSDKLAIESALHLQRAMYAEGLRLRVAIARSPLEKRFRPTMRRYDWDGNARIIAARLLPLGRPGEILADGSIVEAKSVDLDRYNFRATFRTLEKPYIDGPSNAERFHKVGEVVLVYSISRAGAEMPMEITRSVGEFQHP